MLAGAFLFVLQFCWRERLILLYLVCICNEKYIAADGVDLVSQVDVDLMVDLSRPNALLFAECSVCSTRVLKSALGTHERFCRGATDRQARLLLASVMSSTKGAYFLTRKQMNRLKQLFFAISIKKHYGTALL